MQSVFVLSSDKKPLDPTSPAHARKLLRAGQAAIYRHYPFTIILKDRAAAESVTHAHAVKIDPGSKKTGVALVNQAGRVRWVGEIEHRGQQVREALLSRRQLRRARRSRTIRYRPARFDNRRRKDGWLPPSLESRIANVVTWVGRLQKLAPVESLALELVKFDTQLMESPEISGAEYQQGELAGYELREYLLEKWGRKCAYCGATDTPLEMEHLTPKSRGGSDRVSNLTLACHPCNQAKGNQTAAEFGHPEIQAQARQPLKDVAAVNASRWVIYRRLQVTGLPMECGTGGRTKYNRATLGLPKAHWIDAACVGESGASVQINPALRPLAIRATGHGTRQMCRMDKFGFPRTSAKRVRRAHGFRTGDLVRAVVPSGKKAGTHVGRVAVRASGSFDIKTPRGVVQGIGWKHCRLLHRADGYAYTEGGGASSAA
jgi:5-methylcytosine-specific restriction endonuclease McrA